MIENYTDMVDDLLRKGVTNCSKILDDLRKAGYEGGRTSVQDYVRAHADLVPAQRALAPVSSARGRGVRFRTGPGESYQMDWGFASLVDVLGTVWKIACFAMVCHHHCGAFYVEFFTNARQENLFIGMLHALVALGVPESVLTDNK